MLGGGVFAALYSGLTARKRTRLRESALDGSAWAGQSRTRNDPVGWLLFNVLAVIAS